MQPAEGVSNYVQLEASNFGYFFLVSLKFVRMADSGIDNFNKWKKKGVICQWIEAMSFIRDRLSVKFTHLLTQRLQYA